MDIAKIEADAETQRDLTALWLERFGRDVAQAYCRHQEVGDPLTARSFVMLCESGGLTMPEVQLDEGIDVMTDEEIVQKAEEIIDGAVTAVKQVFRYCDPAKRF